MNVLNKLSLCSLAVVAALFASSPIASGAPVEVTDSGGNHCSTAVVGNHVADGGCVLHIVGTEINLIQHINGIPTLRGGCNQEFTLNISEDGEGWITNQALTASHPGIGCGPQPCTESGGSKRPWHAQVSEPEPGREHLIMELCWTTQIAAGVFCHLTGDLELDVIGGPPYSLEAESKNWVLESIVAQPAAAQPNCNGFAGLGPFEIDGHWTLEEQNILLIH